MTDDRTDGLADVINLIAAPIAGGIRTVEQFRRGADELIRAVENLNATMENLNEAAMRINRLMADIEEPVRAMVPQLTRTVRTADEITRRLEGPVKAAAPNIEKVVDTFASPAFTTLPTQLGDFMQLMGDVSKRLGPLAQFAENAGGLFGGFKLPGMSGPRAPTPDERASTPVTAVETRPDDSSTGGRAAAKKATPKKSASKRSVAKKSTARKTTAKKASSKRSSSK